MCLWVFGIENGNHDGRGGAERWNYWVIWTRAIPIHTGWFQRGPISIQSSPALLFLVYWEMCVLHKGVLGNRFCSWLYSSGIWWAILFGMRQRSGMKSEPRAMHSHTEFNPRRKTLSLPTMMTHTCQISRPPLTDTVSLTIKQKRRVNPRFSYHGIRVGLVPNIECP